MRDRSLGQRPSAAVQVVLATSFGLADLSRVRRDVAAVSRRCGLDDKHVEDWVTAVNELLINVVRHGGGRGTVRLLHQDRLTCEVVDQGSGFDTSRYVPRAQRPAMSDSGGMGLWVVGQMAEFLVIDSGRDGTTIHIAPRDSAG